METATKKRRRKGEGSEFQARKKARNSGEAYITKRNITVAAKKPPNERVSCKCKYKCKEIPHRQKTKVFEKFYALGDNEKQSSYLMGLIHIDRVKRRGHGTCDNEEESRRQVTVHFTVPGGAGDTLQVCRKTFQEVFGITHRKVQTLTEKKKRGHVLYDEKRGNKKEFRKYTQEDESVVLGHVNLFHYLSPDLNISRLYCAFKEMYPDKKHITYGFYYNTFHKSFSDLSFKPSRTDTCSTFDLLNAKIKGNPENKRNLERQLQVNHRKAEKAWIENNESGP